ncbi:hypothetical protein [Mucilaginibacter sp. KACC 22063]|uniref:hypothetical protein n=1 Tax=Mucilaginibacter sp. KACC 22063 TaxID=3025666 RepID=UPI0023655095|nr:hypothetical protein [Mucilaginibacter sp. KACC 22063]WDF53511.1 hypothetical protein PQ461_11200 [Mucilaginibacter sp. KACC 22063]
MKKMMLAAVSCLALAACNDDKGQEKKVMDDILKTHEKVMADEDHAVDNKMFIDSLIKNNKLGDTSGKTQLSTLSTQLETADNDMSNWMQKFDPDYKGKSHADVMHYLTKQRSQINKIDSQLTDAIKQSDKALAKYKK